MSRSRYYLRNSEQVIPAPVLVSCNALAHTFLYASAEMTCLEVSRLFFFTSEVMTLSVWASDLFGGSCDTGKSASAGCYRHFLISQEIEKCSKAKTTFFALRR